jgi:hypothetical protein
VETDLVRNVLSVSTESTRHAEKNDSFVRQSSLKAVAAEEVTDS